MKNTKLGTLAKEITLKKLKVGVGHDLRGMYTDFYYKRKKIGYMNDDGYGGYVELVYVNDKMKTDLEDLSDELEISISALIRTLIKKGLSN